MLSPDHELDSAGHARRTHRFRQLDGLVARNERVLRALKRENWSVTLRDERQRRRLGGGLRLLLRSATEEVFDPGLADIGDVFGGQVGRAEVIDDGFDPAVGAPAGTSPSRPSAVPVSPSINARWPPAEKPVAPMRSGSTLYFLAFDLSQRTAAFIS